MPNNFPKLALPLSIIFFIFSCVVFFFLYQKIDSNNSIAEANNVTWQNEMNRRNILSSMDHSIKVIAPEITQLETHFAQSSDVVPFLDSIESVARNAGVKAEVVSVAVPNEESVLLVGMNATGGFEQMYKFVTLLENSPYQLEFDSVEIKRSDTLAPVTKSATLVWSGSFKMRLFSFIK